MIFFQHTLKEVIFFRLPQIWYSSNMLYDINQEPREKPAPNICKMWLKLPRDFIVMVISISIEWRRAGCFAISVNFELQKPPGQLRLQFNCSTPFYVHTGCHLPVIVKIIKTHDKNRHNIHFDHLFTFSFLSVRRMNHQNFKRNSLISQKPNGISIMENDRTGFFLSPCLHFDQCF